MTPASSDPPATFAIAGRQFTAPPLEQGLYLVATPIGNLRDITLRALDTLAACDTICCEDTRITARLLERYAIKATLRAYHDHNAARQRPAIVSALENGASIALVCDAGMPLVSDPGFKLAAAARQAGVPVHVIPGPSAPLAALALSGLASDRFAFMGFLPAKPAQRRKVLSEAAVVPATTIFFDTARRVTASLQAIAETMGRRQVALARELTKIHEEVLRGTAEDLIADMGRRPPLKGEITLVIAPPTEASAAVDDAVIDAALLEAMTDAPPGRAAAAVSRRLQVPRARVYERAMQLKAGAQRP